MNNNILIKNLHVTFNKKNILTDININIPNNSILSVIGKNGIGKTTLINCMSKKIEEYKGTICINKKDIRDYTIKELSTVLSILHSDCQIYNNSRVKDYLVMGLTNEMSLFDTPSDEQYERVYTALKRFKKEYLFDKDIFLLSSGELQIVKIARALLQNTPIMIFDEPTENLDIESQLLILDLLRNLHKKGYTIIVITHNIRHVLELRGKCLFLNNGKYTYCESDDIVSIENLNKYCNSKIEYLKDSNGVVIKFFNNIKIYI